MKKWCLILFATQLVIKSATAQDFTFKNYSTKDFNAHPYMWDAVEDELGRIYFANNDGVLRFDGKNWLTIKTPNPVRHLLIDKLGQIYVACLGDFGAIEFKNNGGYEYVSIKKQLPIDKQKTGGDENVFQLGKSIYFYSKNHLVQTEKEGDKYNTTIWDIEPMNGAFAYDGRLYLNTEELGLGTFERGKIKIIAGGEFLAGKTISDYCIDKGKMLLSEMNGNAYYLRGNTLSKGQTLGIDGIITLASNQNCLAIGTMNNGTKLKGKESKEIATPSKEIYHVFFDHDGNLWTSHGNGLTQTFNSIGVKQFSTKAVVGNITDLLIKNNQLWVSTTAGVFIVNAFNGQLIEKIKGIETECWDLHLLNNKIIVASTDGVFSCEGFSSKLLLSGETILHLQEGNESKKLYALGENGAWIVSENNTVTPIEGIPNLANSIFEKNGKVIFAGTYQDGIVSTNKQVANLLDGFAQLRLHKKNLYAQGKDKVLLWNEQKQNWEENEFGLNLFLGASNKEMEFGEDFVLQLNNGLKVYEKGSQILKSNLFTINGKPLAFAQDNGKKWIAYSDYIYYVENDLVDPKTHKTNINLIEFGGNKIAFMGYFLDKEGLISPTQEIVPEISNEDLPMKISFGLNTLVASEQQQFSYKIEGLNKEWSHWQNSGQIELQGLSGGQYNLYVKGRDAFGNESPETQFKFLIRAPWYLSGWAYLMYLVALFLLIYLIVFLNQRRLLSKNKKLEEKVAERTKELYDEKAKSDELLLNILPVEVAEELKRTGSLEARQFDEVTVLFTDFVGFTSISEKLSPKDLVEEIHYCFKAFDAIIGINKLEKIKTIGDAYMAVCGMPISDKDHALHVVEAAKEINQFIMLYQQERKQAGKPYFEIRMGINSGSVIAGIVGVKKYAYDIWGDTVNTAARMEQNCEPGKINLSGSTFELIKGHNKCSYRGKIEAKNKGRIDMYYLQT